MRWPSAGLPFRRRVRLSCRPVCAVFWCLYLVSAGSVSSRRLCYPAVPWRLRASLRSLMVTPSASLLAPTSLCCATGSVVSWLLRSLCCLRKSSQSLQVFAVSASLRNLRFLRSLRKSLGVSSDTTISWRIRSFRSLSASLQLLLAPRSSSAASEPRLLFVAGLDRCFYLTGDFSPPDREISLRPRPVSPGVGCSPVTE